MERTVSLPLPSLPEYPDHFTFTSSGLHVLVWGRGVEGILRYTINDCFEKEIIKDKRHLHILPEVLAVGGGTEITVVLVSASAVSCTGHIICC